MRYIPAVLPDDARTYRGDAWVSNFTVVLSLIITFRSLVHLFRDDGGAATIAGIDINVEGDQNLVAIFAQWGLVQLLLAGVAWIAIVRYRELIPLVLLINLLENLGRIAIGRSKPLEIAKPPPGAYGSRILWPVLAVAFWQSLPRRESLRAPGCAAWNE